MDWTLGVTNGPSLGLVVLSTLMLMFFICIILSIFIPVPDDKNKIIPYYVSFFFGSLTIAYCTLAYVVTFEINENNYKSLHERIAPYMADQKIKELLNEAKKDGSISSAERDRLYHRASQIEDMQLKEQATNEGEIAKKLLLGEYD